MSKMIQIRDVPDEVHAKLKSRAALASMSLSDYLKRDLQRAASTMTIEELSEQISREPPSTMTTADVVDALREVRGD